MHAHFFILGRHLGFGSCGRLGQENFTPPLHQTSTGQASNYKEKLVISLTVVVRLVYFGRKSNEMVRFGCFRPEYSGLSLEMAHFDRFGQNLPFHLRNQFVTQPRSQDLFPGLRAAKPAAGKRSWERGCSLPYFSSLMYGIRKRNKNGKSHSSYLSYPSSFGKFLYILLGYSHWSPT